jgi:hypothetical protein
LQEGRGLCQPFFGGGAVGFLSFQFKSGNVILQLPTSREQVTKLLRPACA